MNMKCGECKSAMTYIRISTGEQVCRRCGHVEKIAHLVPKEKKVKNKKGGTYVQKPETKKASAGKMV